MIPISLNCSWIITQASILAESSLTHKSILKPLGYPASVKSSFALAMFKSYFLASGLKSAIAGGTTEVPGVAESPYIAWVIALLSIA